MYIPIVRYHSSVNVVRTQFASQRPCGNRASKVCCHIVNHTPNELSLPSPVTNSWVQQIHVYLHEPCTDMSHMWVCTCTYVSLSHVRVFICIHTSMSHTWVCKCICLRESRTHIYSVYASVLYRHIPRFPNRTSYIHIITVSLPLTITAFRASKAQKCLPSTQSSSSSWRGTNLPVKN